MPLKNAYWLLLLPASILIAACTAQHSVLRYDEPKETIVWPIEPEIPRYRYIGQLTGEDNITTSKENFFVGVLKWMVGLYSAKRPRVVLQRPQSGVVDEKRDRIYVIDVSRAAIFVFDEKIGKLSLWNRASKMDVFQTPVGIALGLNGDLYVTDADLGSVSRIGPDGIPKGRFGTNSLERPTGIAIDKESGRLFVADTHAHNIKVFDTSGKLLKTIGKRGESAGEFNFPTFIVINNQKLYVTDTLNSRIQIFDTNGKFIREFGKRGLYLRDLPRPKGITLDIDGNIYVVESYYDHLLVYNSEGKFLLPIGGTGSGIGQFYLPAGVWSDSKNRLFVADMFNGRIVIFQKLS